jgi:hypothetical protein
MTVSEARTRLMRLQVERLDARELGVDESSTYMTQLEAAIADAKSDYVGTAVTQIACLAVELNASAALELTVASN